MNAPCRKVIRDFWLERTRTMLVVLAIALGIAGFTTVLSAYAVLTRELDKGYLATNPASASFTTDAIDDALLRAVAADRQVSGTEPRRAVSGRIKAGPAQWRNLTLFAVKDYGDIRIGKLNPEQGAWPPRRGEILIERDALGVAGARIGDTVTVRTSRGGEHTLRITGSVHDVGRAQARMENVVYGYVTLDTLAEIGEEPFFDQLNILVSENRFDENHIRLVAADIQNLMETLGHPVRRIDVPTPGKHPHAAIMGLLLLAMSTFGLFVLILSGILVINLLTALMASQVRQIGIMKAIGGTRGQIARIYFGQALILGVAAVLVALPMGVLGSRVLCRALAVFLNFDVTSFAAPAWVYLLVGAVGLGFPLLTAAYPIVKGSGVTIIEALTDFGVSRNVFGTTAFDRLLAGVSGLTRPVLLAVRNGFRRRMRLVLTVLTLAVGGLFFMSALNVRASLIRTLDRLFDSKKFDLAVGFGAMYPFDRVQTAARWTPGVLRTEGWIMTEASISDSPESVGASLPPAKIEGLLHGDHTLGRERFSVVALPDETQMLVLDVAQGRGLRRGDTDAIVVNTALAAKEPRMKVGRAVSISMGPAQTSWRVVGVTREPFSPPAAYVTRRLFDERGHAGMINSIRLALDKTDPASVDRVRASLEKNLADQDIPTLGSLSKSEGRYGFDQHMVMIYVLLIVTSCIIGGVGGLGLATTMSLNVLERRREMGVLRAIGATPAAVWLIVVAEGAAIGIVSWAVAALAAWPVSKVIGNLLVRLMFQNGLDFSFEKAGLWIWLAVSVSLAAVASILPAWNAARRPVREALGTEWG